MVEGVSGLSAQEAARRLEQFGPNSLPAAPPLSLLARVLRQFASPLVYLLLAALVLDLGAWLWHKDAGWPLESMAIGLILLTNALLGAWQENKSEAALAKLAHLANPWAWALRDGSWVQLKTHHLVPGDLVRIEAGDRIPADGVLLDGGGLLVDESVLTGESQPVDKGAGEELFSSTLLVRGKGHLQVARTGSESALGKLASLLGKVQASKTPLEKRLDALGRRIVRWVLLLTLLIALGGVWMDGTQRLAEVLVFAVALAVAAVPEGLPAVLTLTLALGVERMARRKAIVRRLAAVEALGSVTVIVTDKTGTLTENQLHVRKVDSPDPEKALRALVLANDAEHGVGDPLEVALLAYAVDQGCRVDELRAHVVRISERSFDSGHKYMRVSVREAGLVTSYLKGAPEVLLERSQLSERERASWQEKALAYASEGYRVLGIAWATGETEGNLEFGGLALFWDPPRKEVAEALRQTQEAGIRVLMVTGDHPATALAVARQVGLPGDLVLTGEDLEAFSPQALKQALAEVNVFARVRPEHKLKLVETLKDQGEIVAMTGDGVNDAPALKRSDVGVSMGQRGSDVAREVADLVLSDDNFATIVNAVEQGRGIYENIQKFLRFLFATNLAEVLVVAVGTLLTFTTGLRDQLGGVLLPLTAVQILWINLVTDSLPALSLALDQNPGVMRLRPKPPGAPLLSSSSVRYVVAIGALSALAALLFLSLMPMLGYRVEEARSAAFHFLAIVQFLLVFPARHTTHRPLPNPTLWRVVALGITLQVLVGSLPATMAMLQTSALAPALWGAIFGMSLLTLGLAELVNRLLWRKES